MIALDAISSKFELGWHDTPLVSTWSHTCTGSNLILIVAVQIFQDVSGTGTVTAATYNGVAMTKVIDKLVAGTTMYTAIYYLLNPDAGAHTISMTVTGVTDDIKYEASSWTGVGGIDNSASAGGVDTPASVTFSTIADNCEVVDSILKYGINAITKGASQTEIAKNNATYCSGGSSYLTALKTPAGSVTMTWTWTSDSNDWSICAVSLSPSGPVVCDLCLKPKKAVTRPYSFTPQIAR
jgi:hypothetical protein